jgi:hypothetical protein
MFKYERRDEPVLRWSLFLRRLYNSLSLGAALVSLSLAMGMAGYHYLEGLSWIDAYLNAAMILSGMGPVAEPHTLAGKLFAGAYALFSGFAVLIIAGIAFAPIAHRILHRFHASPDRDDARKPRS